MTIENHVQSFNVQAEREREVIVTVAQVREATCSPPSPTIDSTSGG